MPFASTLKSPASVVPSSVIVSAMSVVPVHTAISPPSAPFRFAKIASPERVNTIVFVTLFFSVAVKEAVSSVTVNDL